MTEKTGRTRMLSFEDIQGADKGTSWMLGMLIELGERVYDQVEHLDDKALNFAPAGSYLLPSVLLLHLVTSELGKLHMLVGNFEMPPYADEVSNTNASDLPDIAPPGRRAVEILKQYLSFRRELLLSRCNKARHFDEPSGHPRFPTRRDLMGHLIWHWSNHSGHIGASTLSAGHEYIWQ